MIFWLIVIMLFGLILLIRPDWSWMITEKWKSNDATEPSNVYKLSTRFGGVICILLGGVGLLVLLLT
ncbi:hypothetical protein GCM10025857_12560 [Alicyclobacillus contaminans]|uniref:DUF6199 family natural product biosynthesis protein n=1 Tax=Alicyclobacillus contaminans TaxID=392016 RepID=UPI00047E0051|nr:hypothetical protein GCM10025857_12560 [Alicyclobacillus contaminans]